MSRLLLLLALLLVAPASSMAQSKIDADDLPGAWKLVIDVDTKAEEADNAIARMALKAVGGLLDEVDVRFLFREDGLIDLEVTAFDEEADVDEDEISWEITRHGGLLLGDNDQFDSQDTIFFLEGGNLVAFELNEDGKPGARKDIYLERVDT